MNEISSCKERHNHKNYHIHIYIYIYIYMEVNNGLQSDNMKRKIDNKDNVT